MDGSPGFQQPANGQPQRQRKSPRNNQQQQWRERSQHNNNNSSKQHRVPPQQQKNFKRRNNNGKRQTTGLELGFFGSVPSLQDLQRENRKRTRRHYGNHSNNQRGAFKPPPPPYFPHYLSNDTTIRIDNNKPKIPWLSPLPPGRFLAPPPAPTPARFPGPSPAVANALATPIVPANHANDADKLEAEGLHAGLDFFATNDGLVLYNDSPAPSNWTDDDDNDGEMDSHSLSGSEDEDNDGDEDGDGEHNDHHRRHARLRRPAGSTLAGNGFGGGHGGGGGGSNAHVKIIQRLRERVAQQDAYIAELEDDNLRYRERLDLLVHQFREIQQGNDPAGAGATTTDVDKNDETSKELEPTAAVAAAAVPATEAMKIDNDGSEMNESPAGKASKEASCTIKKNK
jgi:hypothetical protein